MIMQTKFKVGDKVRCVKSNLRSITLDQVYTVFRVRDGRYSVYTDLGSVGVYPEWVFAAVEPNPVLTPEEVFEHLRKGTQLQFRIKGYAEWFDHQGTLQDTTVNALVIYTWRIKPEPEVIELNGKRYKLIEE